MGCVWATIKVDEGQKRKSIHVRFEAQETNGVYVKRLTEVGADVGAFVGGAVAVVDADVGA